MSGYLLAACSQTKKCILVGIANSYGLLQYKVSFCNGSGFVHNNSFDISHRLKCNTTLEKDAFLGTCSNTGEKRQRNTQYQCARAAHDQEGQSGVDPVVPVTTGNKRRKNSSSQCQEYNDRSVDSGELGNKTVYLRFACRSIFNGIQNTSHHRFRKWFLYLQF